MDPGTKDRLLRNITIAATALSAALLLSTDYGPHPHALSSVSNSVRGIKDWFWTPSQEEHAELQRRLSRKPPRRISRLCDGIRSPRTLTRLCSRFRDLLFMAASVRLATRLDAPLVNLMVHELAEVEGMAAECESTAAKLGELLFTHAPFQGPTVFILEVEEPPMKKKVPSEDKDGTPGRAAVADSEPEISPLLDGAEANAESVELMLFRSFSSVKYNGKFSSDIGRPKLPVIPLETTTDMEESVLEVFRSDSDVSIEAREVHVATPEDAKPEVVITPERPVKPEVVSEVRCLVEDPEQETFRSPCTASHLVVGFLHVYPNFSTYLCKPGLYMDAFYIREPYRQQGFGKMFLKKIAREAVKLGAERMEWSVLYSNDRAIKFYEGLGAGIKPGFRRCAIRGRALANCEP